MEHGNEHFTGCHCPLLFEASIVRVDDTIQKVADSALEELFDESLEGIAKWQENEQQ